MKNLLITITILALLIGCKKEINGVNPVTPPVTPPVTQPTAPPSNPSSNIFLPIKVIVSANDTIIDTANATTYYYKYDTSQRLLSDSIFYTQSGYGDYSNVYIYNYLGNSMWPNYLISGIDTLFMEYQNNKILNAYYSFGYGTKYSYSDSIVISNIHRKYGSSNEYIFSGFNIDSFFYVNQNISTIRHWSFGITQPSTIAQHYTGWYSDTTVAYNFIQNTYTNYINPQYNTHVLIFDGYNLNNFMSYNLPETETYTDSTTTYTSKYHYAFDTKGRVTKQVKMQSNGVNSAKFFYY